MLNQSTFPKVWLRLDWEIRDGIGRYQRQRRFGIICLFSLVHVVACGSLGQLIVFGFYALGRLRLQRNWACFLAMELAVLLGFAGARAGEG